MILKFDSREGFDKKSESTGQSAPHSAIRKEFSSVRGSWTSLVRPF